ncbi:ABC transporter ATP-binding protein [Pelagibacterium lacus]|uniref:ABC transporter ATP-binding protein n=1 Tax=Pelagibacterium lacus TaxID=2282655 RepID=A0A369W4P6_9HYPH|nr:ABC transporter ATP-binding protein [Pelagibacterium lacus]RDE09528.1 ABC transporter ATP-binding protein [Pelagibacterium lacus]
MSAVAEDDLLVIDDLHVQFDTRAGVIHGLRGLSLTVARGETLGIVGESGSGKSVMAQSVMGLIDTPGEIVRGDIRFKGRSLLGPKGRSYGRKIRGRELAMIFQNPMTSLNPLMTIGAQIEEVIVHHLGKSAREARQRALELLDLVGITSPVSRLSQLPHELSGGMKQRIIIAMAIACEPELLIADEPTTALDVTVQAQILELINDIQKAMNLSIILITHDLGVVAQSCHRVMVMYAGKEMEEAPVGQLFSRPAHYYTAGLLRSTPRLRDSSDRLFSIDGAPPSLIDPPTGCPFFDRCEARTEECRMDPPAVTTGNQAKAMCWHV